MEQMGSIHGAVLQGDLKCVMRLVDADPSLVHARVGYEAYTPLHVAAKKQHVHIVAYLLHRGAKLDERDRLGFTALCLVCATGRGVGRRDVVEVLLACGADVCVRAHNGMTPVTAAAAGGDSELLRMLLAREDGADTVDAPGAWRKSALWDACRYGRIKVARVLLEAGADPTRADKDGRNPMDIAAVSKRHKGCVKLLQEWERSYLMIKSRRLYDFSLTTTTKPTSLTHTLSDIPQHTHPIPAYLAPRTVTTTPTTRTSMHDTTAINTAIGIQDHNRGMIGGGDRYPVLDIVDRGWRSFGAGGGCGGAGVRTAVLSFALEVLQGELFVEVMDAAPSERPSSRGVIMSDDDGGGGGGRDFRRLGRGFGGDNDDEDLDTDVLRPEGRIGYFSSKSVPAGMELEIALMKEERERDKTINKEDSHVVDRRVWENHEIGVGYQHKTVVRQPQAQHHTVKVKDMSAGGKKRKEDGGEEGNRAKKARKQGGGMDEEVVAALKKLRALITIELRRRAKAMARIKGNSTTTTAAAAAASNHGANGGSQGKVHAEGTSERRGQPRAVDGGGGDGGGGGGNGRDGGDVRGGPHRNSQGRVKRASERQKDATAPTSSTPSSSSSSPSDSDSADDG